MLSGYMLTNDMMMDESSREMVGHDRETHVQEESELISESMSRLCGYGSGYPFRGICVRKGSSLALVAVGNQIPIRAFTFLVV